MRVINQTFVKTIVIQVMSHMIIEVNFQWWFVLKDISYDC